MTVANITASREKFGGQMSDGELRFCRMLRECIHQTLEGRGDLELLLMELLWDLQEIRRRGLDVDSAFDSGWCPTIEVAERARKSIPAITLPSDGERAVLEDMDGLIDYAMRNGISFDTVFAALVHDVGQLRGKDDSFNLAEAEKNFAFHLRTTGWAKRNLEVFGDVEPDME